MGRAEHFQQGSSEHTFPPLYHGSGNLMKPGAVIKPGSEGLAFASSHRDTAAMFASYNSNRTLQSELTESKPQWRQSAIFNPVYSVEPAKDTRAGYNDTPEYHVSKTGFKIKGIHSWASEGEPLTESPSEIAKDEEYVKNRRSGI